MKKITIRTAGPPGRILLGKQGENQATEVVFDLSGLEKRYGAGRALLFHERHGDHGAHPVEAQQTEEGLRWVVSNGETALAGSGKAELHYYVGETLAKTMIFDTFVMRSLEGGGEVPDPVEPWYQKVMKRVEELGGIQPQDVQTAVDDYLDRHPVGAVDQVAEGNMNPVTSNAVYVLAGNIEALMGTI